MQYKTTMMILFVTAGLNMTLAAEMAAEPDQAAKESSAVIAEDAALIKEIALPEKGSIEYWNVRSEAITELLPFLTKKRTDMKKYKQLLADYLIEIGKAEEFAGRNIPVSFDAKIYAEILQIGQGMEEMNIPKPEKRPSWDDIMDVAMKHVIFEGYLPTAVDAGDDLKQYTELCKKKEEYGQKVREDLRGYLDQCARVWVYLESIGKKDSFKVHYADMKLEQASQTAAQKQRALEQKRAETLARSQEKEQQKHDDALDRASFSSGRRERVYDTAADQRLYRQSQLDERYTNSRAYYY